MFYVLQTCYFHGLKEYGSVCVTSWKSGFGESGREPDLGTAFLFSPEATTFCAGIIVSISVLRLQCMAT